MRPIKRKMQFIYLQEQYCKSCVFRKNSLQYCSEFCNIGKELVLLNALGFKRRKRKELTKKKNGINVVIKLQVYLHKEKAIQISLKL